MNTSHKKSIDAILDTPKVEGLLIFDLEGNILFEQLPDYTIVSELKKLPQRILTLYEVIGINFQNCSDFILKYTDKNLYFRKTASKKSKNFVIAVVGAAGVNFVALKLITNLALKLVEFDDESGDKPPAKRSRSFLTYRGSKG